MSRSEFFARAAQAWLKDLEEEGTTEAIDRVLSEGHADQRFTDAAAAALAHADTPQWPEGDERSAARRPAV